MAPAVENHSTRENSKQGNPEKFSFAAVAYLNMLPFFADDQTTQLFSSPRLLNSKQPTCHAFCSSLITGLNSQLSPVTTQFGVFSSGPVQSVYIEPVIHSESHSVFWKQLEELWAHRHPNPVSGLQMSDVHGHIVLRSSGASEQSVWMLNVLMALAGFSVDLSIDNQANDQLQAKSANADKHPPEARLWIGDPALERRFTEPNAYRIDVGHIWNSHIGHKAWFAGWFVGAGSTQSADAQNDVSRELYNRIRSWNNRSEFSRWCATYKFLESQNSPLIQVTTKSEQTLTPDDQHWELRDSLSEYFSLIEWSISAEEGQYLWALYNQLNSALIANQANLRKARPVLQQSDALIEDQHSQARSLSQLRQHSPA